MILVVISEFNSKGLITNRAIQLGSQMSLYMHLKSFNIISIEDFFTNRTFRLCLLLCQSSTIIGQNYSFLYDATDNAGFLPIDQICKLVLTLIFDIFRLFLHYSNLYRFVNKCALHI